MPRFTLSTHTEYKYLPQSICITNEMNPVVGVRLLFAPSISVMTYARRKIATLLPSTKYSPASRQRTFYLPLLYHLFYPIIKSTSTPLAERRKPPYPYNYHSYTHSYLSHFNAISNQTMPYQGLRTHLFSGSVEKEQCP